jgi:hypothetical protein
MKSLPKRFTLPLAALLLVIISLAFAWNINSRSNHPRIALRSQTPYTLLSEANRLSWLGNWYEARALYQEAEARFHVTEDTEHEVYARIGRIRAQAQMCRLIEVCCCSTMNWIAPS